MTKNKILCCIFDGKLVLENGRVAATPFSPAVQVLLNITNRFQRVEKKKEVKFDLFSELAPLTVKSCSTLPTIQPAILIWLIISIRVDLLKFKSGVN